MTKPLPPELYQRYLETEYIVSDDPPLPLHVREYNPDAVILLASFGVSGAAFITAWNPHSERLSDEENETRQARLLAEIEAMRLNYLVGFGEGVDWREYSYLILGIERAAADDLAVRFEQNAYLWLADNGIPELVVV